jgi:hypothetical protein
MKNVKVKYTEAVERNLKNAKASKYKGLKLDEAKHKLGIRIDDIDYDKKVGELIKTGGKK